jgi:hypothetical protein
MFFLLSNFRSLGMPMTLYKDGTATITMDTKSGWSIRARTETATVVAHEVVVVVSTTVGEVMVIEMEIVGDLVVVEVGEEDDAMMEFVGPSTELSSPVRFQFYRINFSLTNCAQGNCSIKIGLPPSGSWQDLKDHMREAGDVCFADVTRDGSGHVEFLREEDMKYAIKKLDDTKFRSHEVSPLGWIIGFKFPKFLGTRDGW